MTLDELPEAFAAARVTASTAAIYPRASTPRNTCRYCGRFWKAVPGTRIDGHARCVVGVAFQHAVHELRWNDPALTRHRIGEVCGVSSSVVSAWTTNVDERIARTA